MINTFFILVILSAQFKTALIDRLLTNHQEAETRSFLQKNRTEGEKYFHTALNRLLQFRSFGNQAKASEIEKKLSFLSRLFIEEFGEKHLHVFLNEYSSWDKEQIKRKYNADRKYLLARFLWKSNKYEIALKDLKEACTSFKSLPDTNGTIKSLILQGQFQWLRGRSKIAESCLLEALAKAEKISHHTAMERILSPLGSIYLRQGNHAKAKKAFQKILSICLKIKDRKGESWALGCLGQTAVETGMLDEALSFYKKALSLPGRAGEAEGEFYYGLGRAYSEQRDHLSAFRAFEKALSKAAASDDDLRTKVNISLAALWRRENDFDRAEKAYLRALETAEKKDKHHMIAGIWNNLANLYQFKDEYNKADKLYQKALSVERELNDLAMTGRILTNLSLLAWKREDYSKGDKLYSQAMVLLKKTGDRAAQAELTKELGFARLSEDKLSEAKAHLKDAEMLFRKLRDLKGLAGVEIGLGKVAIKKGNKKQACHFFSESIKNLELQREKVTSARYRDIFLNTEEYAEVFALYAGTLIDTGKKEEAFDAAEKSKARGLSAELLWREKASAILPPKFRKKREELRSKQTLLRQKLATSQGQSYKKYIVEFDKNERQCSILEEKIWSVFPRNRPYKTAALDTVKNSLKPGVLLLEYLLGKERSFVFALTKTDFKVFTLESETKIKKATEDLLKLCHTPFSDPKEQAGKTAGLILKPLAEEINSAKKLLIIPDGILQGLPFGILRLNGKYLIESIPVCYLPSASLALQKRNSDESSEKSNKNTGPLEDSVSKAETQKKSNNNSKSQAQSFVFGDPDYRGERVIDPELDWGKVEFPPIKASRIEAEKIAKVLKAKLFIGKSATETALKSVLPRARYLHLAVHSIIHPSRPRLSSILLSRGEGNDGIMELREITKNSGELVVLSACKSGLGERSKGEGFLGFGRGLIEAGTKRVVLSYWNVNDRSASEIMPVFWRAFVEKHDGATALRRAKLEFLNSARKNNKTTSFSIERGRFNLVKKKINLEHPFFWGGFVILSGIFPRV